MDLRPLVLPSYRSAVEASNFLVGSLIAYHDLWIVQARWLLLNEWLCLPLLVGSCQTALYLPLFDWDDERRLFDALVISILNLLIWDWLVVLTVRLLPLQDAAVRVLHEL